MELLRNAANKSGYRKSLIKPGPINNMTVNDEGNLEILFRNQREPGTSSAYNYRIVLTPDDIGKIIAEAMKQALTKSK